MDTIFLLDAALFLALTVLTVARAHRTGHESLRRLAPFLGVVVALSGVAPLVGSGLAWLGIAVLVGGLALYPVLLLRFGASLAVVPGRWRSGVRWVAGGAVGLILLGPFVMEMRTALLVDLSVLAAAALAAHVVLFVVIARQASRLRSSYVRRRANALNGGLTVMALSLAAGVFVSRFTALPVVVAPAGAVVAGLLLIVSTAPPRWLQAVFILPDRDALEAAEERLATAENTEAGAASFLAAVGRLLGGDRVWFLRDGVLMAGDDPVQQRWDDADDGTRSGVSSRLLDDGGPHQAWVLRSRLGGDELGVVTGRVPVMYGLDHADLLPRMTRRLGAALDARQLDDQRRAQAHAEQQAAHYRQVAALKDDLLSTINHELRTAVSTVAGALELVEHRWDELDEGQRRLFVERAVVNTNQLRGVVLDVLALASLRMGTTQCMPRVTPLPAVLDEALQRLDHGGRVTVDCQVGTVRVDPELASQVIHHLVRNALQHTDGDVRVVVSGGGTTDAPVTVAVEDEGGGFTDGVLATLERGGHYMTRTTRGLGLGLSLVVETVDLLGGEVAFEHAAAGTRVTCVLPQQRPVEVDELAAAHE